VSAPPPVPHHVIALDPGTALGVARWRAPDEVWSGTVKLEGKSVGARLNFAASYLADKVEAFADRGEPITAIFAEDFQGEAFRRHRKGASSNAAVEFLTMLKGIILAVGVGKGVPVELVSAATWRRTFLPKPLPHGRDALKAAAVAEAKRRGWKPTTSDQAEALGLAHHARCTLDPAYAAASTELFRRAA
jgi:hypothetical protein